MTAFILESNIDPELAASFALRPLGSGFTPRQLVSYAFLHANVGHLAVNMFGLWMFGREVEATAQFADALVQVGIRGEVLAEPGLG